MQTLTHNVKWQVSLSNGETFFEEKGDFKTIPDIKSPWLRLMDYVVDNQVEITSLSLYTDNGMTFNLPSAGKNPKFKAFGEAKKPLDYLACRKMGQDFIRNGNKLEKTDKVDLFTVIIAYYENYQLQLWVDENNPRNCWTLVVDNE
jgi:hypothetical protein